MQTVTANVDPTKIFAGGFRIFQAPTGEALPDFDDIAPPSIVGPNVGGLWIQVGGQGQAAASLFRHEVPEIQQVRIWGATSPIKRINVEELVFFEFMADELNLLQLTRAGGVLTFTQVTAAADQTGKDVVVAGGVEMEERAWLIIGLNENSGTRFLHMPKANAVGGIELTGQHEHAGTAVRLEALSDLTQSDGQQLYRLEDVLIAATS